MGLLGDIIGSAISAKGAKKAAKIQAKAVEHAADLEHARYEQTRSDFQPYMQSGYNALNAMNRQLGLPSVNNAQPTYSSSGFQSVNTPWGMINIPQYEQQQPTMMDESLGRYEGFEETPGYRFTRDQALDAQEHQATGRGKRFSGASLKEGARYAAGLASQEYGNYFERLKTIAGYGGEATNRNAFFGAQSASNQGTLALAGGMSRASGVSTRADIWSDAAKGIGSAVGDWWKNRSQPEHYSPIN